MAARDIVIILSRISFGAIATFLAILYWSHTRDIAWMLIIVSVIVQYGQIMYSTFKLFGMLGGDIFIIKDVLDVGTLLSVISLILTISAFIVLLVRFKRD